MSDPTIMLRLCGVAAVLGGLLRFTSPFYGALLDDQALHLTWVFTDYFLLIAMAGLFLVVRRRAGLIGLAGVLVAVLGVLLVRSAGAQIFGGASYAVGAGLWLIGLAWLAMIILLRKAGFRLAASLWMAALFIGVFGRLLPLETMLWLDASGWAGLVFAAGFVAAGIEMIRRPWSLPSAGAPA